MRVDPGAFVAVEFVNGEFNGKVVKDGGGDRMWVRFHGHSKPLLVRGPGLVLPR